MVGDDLTVTNPRRIQRAVEEKACNCLLLKVNQIGSVTEAIKAWVDLVCMWCIDRGTHVHVHACSMHHVYPGPVPQVQAGPGERLGRDGEPPLRGNRGHFHSWPSGWSLHWTGNTHTHKHNTMGNAVHFPFPRILHLCHCNLHKSSLLRQYKKC